MTTGDVAGYVDTVRRYLVENFGADAEGIEEDYPLLENVLDSVGILKLVTHLEESYGISIEAHEMDPANFATLREMGGFIARKVASR
jgi:acyl carrier protein